MTTSREGLTPRDDFTQKVLIILAKISLGNANFVHGKRNRTIFYIIFQGVRDEDLIYLKFCTSLKLLNFANYKIFKNLQKFLILFFRGHHESCINFVGEKLNIKPELDDF